MVIKNSTKDELVHAFTGKEGFFPESPKLTIIIVSYNMERELPRTVISLLPPYQEEVLAADLELIIVDNGSNRPPVRNEFPNHFNVRILYNSITSASPVSAINLGISAANADLIGVLIDGARMASPGLCNHVLKASQIYPRAIISTLGFHLGPEVQMESVIHGYNQDIEDQLLEAIDWRSNGYKLFEISALAGSIADGYFQPMAESNALFMTKSLWQELDGFDERFESPGGGYANLDAYRRACELSDTELVVLLNEGTFHQVHGGVATNSKREDATPKIFKDEYKTIRQKQFAKPEKVPVFFESFIPEANSFLQYSIKKVKKNTKAFERQQNTLNRILLKHSYCKQFESNDSVLESTLNSPVIITGRGGSGTRLLSKLMQDLNLFLGNEINSTGDSTQWVGPVYDLVINEISLKNNNFEQKHIDRLRANAKNILSSGKFSSGLWGFKLPETMLCLPELLKAFPNAKIIHLVRHPVSISLRRSHMTSRLGNPVGKTVLNNAYKFFNLDVHAIEDKEDYFNNAVSWAYQLEQVLTFVENDLSYSNYLQVKFENLIDHAEEALLSICEFLDISAQAVPELFIDAQRLNHIHEASKEVDEIWALCGKAASHMGYSKFHKLES